MNVAWVLVLVYLNAAGQPSVAFELDKPGVAIAHPTKQEGVDAGEKRRQASIKQVPWLHTDCVEIPSKT